MSRIDYEKDEIKHFVRFDGWLEAFKYRSKRVRRAINGEQRTQPLSYFTFCASSAIDVFMLERAGLLRRDKKSDRLDHVYYCECEEREFQTIANLIGSSDAGFMEQFEEFVLFKDDNRTRGKQGPDPLKKVPDAELRRKFLCKSLHRKFLDLFPFDVINLDLYGNLFPPKGAVFSPMLQTIGKIFEWQRQRATVDEHECEAFTLFLTVYVHKDHMNASVLKDLAKTAKANMTHQEIATAFTDKFQHDDPERLMNEDFPVFFAIILPKLVAKMARPQGWFGTHRKIYIYDRPELGDYHMMTSVVCYERLDHNLLFPGPSGDEAYLEQYVPEIASLFKHKPCNVNEHLTRGGEPLRSMIVDELEQIIAYRGEVLARRI